MMQTISSSPHILNLKVEVLVFLLLVLVQAQTAVQLLQGGHLHIEHPGDALSELGLRRGVGHLVVRRAVVGEPTHEPQLGRGATCVSVGLIVCG